ncbi:hypothetical protein QT231_15810 [Halomonas sp. SpR1]|uniref:hypothetical protein n=1 Tax=Halomonas sp. SpR1 TaxID=3050462 RepID=UPI0027E50D0B|nr:hypothetical protein [Halomonas sp. SpR1]MDQ7734179.1 hypothetical protein [Halomonas sp. SpR1]
MVLIGRQLALRFNAFGNTVIVASQRMETLEETIAGQRDMHAMVVDIENPEDIAGFAERDRHFDKAMEILSNYRDTTSDALLTEARFDSNVTSVRNEKEMRINSVVTNSFITFYRLMVKSLSVTMQLLDQESSQCN